MKQLMFLPIALLIISSASAASRNSSTDILKSLRAAERIVNSLQPSKPGQARVYAVNGSEFTAAEALWMKGQLRAAERAATVGEVKEVANRVQLVMATLKAHGSYS